jgi:hypothetical protein
MLHDAFHQQLAQAAPSERFQHENVAQIGYRSQIGYHSAKSNLGCLNSRRICGTRDSAATLIINPKAQRMLKRARDQFS